MVNYVAQIIFYGIPVAALLFFIVSLYRYIRAKIENRKKPGTYSSEELKNRKIQLIVSSLIVVVLVGVVIAFMALLAMMIVNM